MFLQGVKAPYLIVSKHLHVDREVLK